METQCLESQKTVKQGCAFMKYPFPHMYLRAKDRCVAALEKESYIDLDVSMKSL